MRLKLMTKKSLVTASTLALLLGSGVAAAQAPASSPAASPAAKGKAGKEAPANVLSKKEKAQGWKLLFDGKTLDGFRPFKGEGAPKNWGVEDGTLAWQSGGGDIVTKDEYESFELVYEWKISEGGNSGVFFHVTEDHKFPWETGPEMQVLDNTKHPDGKKAETSAGANYALHGVPADVAKPVGEWNQARLVVKGAEVEHWLNGKKVVAYTLWNDEWKAKVAASKFSKMPDYGQRKKGFIALQDHGNRVWFRNIKVRSL